MELKNDILRSIHCAPSWVKDNQVGQVIQLTATAANFYTTKCCDKIGYKWRISIYRELLPIAEYRTQLAFKSKQEHTDAEIPHGSRDNAIEPDNVKIMFAIDIDSKGKTCSIVNSVSKILIKKIQQCLHQRKLIQSVKRISMMQEHLLKWKKYEEKLLQSVFKLTKS